MKAILLLAASLSLPAFAANPGGPRTFCNPINLDYRLQPDNPCRREAADPVCLYFKGDYYIFASKSGGYWSSPDFVNWTLNTPKHVPLEAYAPSIFEYDGALYFMASETGTLHRSSDPKNPDSWTLAGNVNPVVDPALFRDDDGRVFLYYGCSQGQPIRGVELDPKNQFREIGKPFDCLLGNEKQHGWEVQGDTNTGDKQYGTVPWIEGAWMTKHDGKYYLQYAAPGTQYDSYGDGIYLSDKPTGPFTYAAYSPFSFKPTGFMTGAGHGCSFQDKDGHWWHISTGAISVRHMFERRLVVNPVFFDKEGRMSANTRFGDLPQFLPGRNPKPEQGSLVGWMLLNFGKPVTASSSLSDYPPELAADERSKTWWSAQTGNPGEWLQVDLGEAKTLRALQVNFAEQDIAARGRTTPLAQKYKVECSPDGQTWSALVDKSANEKDAPHDYIELEKPVEARFLRLICTAQVPGGGKFAVRDFRLFGIGHGKAPDPVKSVTATRDAKDGRAATITWPAAQGAHGYAVRYGTAKDALYTQYEVRGETTLTIHSLNVGVPYWFSVEAFNENGVTKFGSTPVELK